MARPGLTYLAAIGVLALAILLRWLLDPLMGDGLPLVTLFGAVAAAVWLGGYRPAILVVIVGYAACMYLFIQPRGRLISVTPGDLVGLGAYLFTCSLIVAIGEGLRRANVRVNAQRETLRVTLGSIGDAVITTDTEGRITYLNSVAESLTGWTVPEALGQPLDAVFRILNEETREPVKNPATQALRKGVVVGLAKTAAYGVAVPLVACQAGLAARGGAPGVGRATTRAVIGASTAVLFLDLVIGTLGYLIEGGR